MRRLIAVTALLAAAATLLSALFGCSRRLTGVPLGNKPPHTVIFVQGPVDTVNHVVQLYWYGTDQDGYVRGYEIKLVNPEDTVAADSAWHLTARTDTILTIRTPEGHATPIFYARAIDNLGARDPHPAVETFKFRNHPPFVTLKVVPNHLDRSDTTYASVTVSWAISDPDGDATKATYRIWLDGRESAPDIVTGLKYTVPSDRFLVNGAWTSGPRTLSVQAIDDGGMAGNIATTTWYVRSPVPSPDMTPGRRPGRLLILDDLPRTAPSNFVDTLYTNTAIRNLPAGSWSVLRVDAFQPFKTSEDLAQTLKLYDAVIWYRGALDSVSTLLGNFEPGVRSYLDSGGSLYLEGLFLLKGVNAEGALTQDFTRTYLDCYGLRNVFVTALAFIDSTAGWGNTNSSYFVSTMFPDTLRQQLLPGSRVGGAGGIRVFNAKHASDIALMAAPGAITPASPDSLPVGISVPQAAGGRVMVFTVPIAVSLPRGTSAIPRVMARIFAQLGLVGP